MVDLDRDGGRLRTEIDDKIEAIQGAGVKPSCIVLDVRTYQLWCIFQASEREVKLADEWSNGELDLQPECEYRDIPIVTIPRLDKIVSVTADMQDVWQDLDAFIRVAGES